MPRCGDETVASELHSSARQEDLVTTGQAETRFVIHNNHSQVSQPCSIVSGEWVVINITTATWFLLQNAANQIVLPRTL